MAFFKTKSSIKNFENRPWFINAFCGKIKQGTVINFSCNIIRVIIRKRNHGNNFGCVNIHQDSHTAKCLKFFNTFIEFTANSVLQTGINRKLNRNIRFSQTRIKLFFHTGNANVVNVGGADELSKQIFMRIDSFFAVLKFQPRNTEIIYLILLRGREVALYVNKRAFFSQLSQNIFIANIRQNGSKFLSCTLGINNFTWIRIKINSRERSRNNRTVSIHDISAFNGVFGQSIKGVIISSRGNFFGARSSV